MASIWLRPEGRQEQRLQELINRLAEEHGTVTFAPHLTVCGVPGDLAVLDAAAAYVRECGLLPLRVAKTAVAGMVITPFRAVFIEVANSAELREFRERLRDIVDAPPLIPPHISLLYTLDRNSQAPRPDFDAERLKAIAARCAEAIDDAHFALGRPVVNSAGGEHDVRSWNVIRSLQQKPGGGPSKPNRLGLARAVYIATAALLGPQCASAGGNLVLYCAVQEEWCRNMVAAFERQTGIKVAMTRKSSGEFYAQLQAEASNPRGDI